jgi:hypothetical protein
MKYHLRNIVICLHLLVSVLGYGQISPYRNFDFSSGEYRLVYIARGKQIESNTIQEYHTEDTTILKQFQTDWLKECKNTAAYAPRMVRSGCKIYFEHDEKQSHRSNDCSPDIIDSINFNLYLLKGDSVVNSIIVHPKSAVVYWDKFWEIDTKWFQKTISMMTPVHRILKKYESWIELRLDFKERTRSESVIFPPTSSLEFDGYLNVGNYFKELQSTDYAKEKIQQYYLGETVRCDGGIIYMHQSLLDKLNSERKFWVAEYPTDSNYSNYIKFYYPHDSTTLTAAKDWNLFAQVENQLMKQVSLAYPNAKFELKVLAYGNMGFVIRLDCNESLASRFDLYPIGEGIYSWHQFAPELIYWIE